jgi:hypothetical protein
MTSGRRRSGCIATLASVTALSAPACIGDIFPPTEQIKGGYRLLQFESGLNYYLCKGNHCGGETRAVLDGSVKRLGWSDRYLVLMMNGPAEPGWRVVDLATDRVDGPLTDAAFERLRITRPEIAAINVRSVQDAWKALGGS